MSRADIRIRYRGDTVLMQWDGSQASEPILVDGEGTPYQTADARHRTGIAVALVARHVWPDAEWPAIPSTGSIPDDWDQCCAAWDDLSYGPEVG